MRLANFVGLTQTMALLANSPPVDAGTSVGAQPTGQRGRPCFGQVAAGTFEFRDHIFSDGFE